MNEVPIKVYMADRELGNVFSREFDREGYNEVDTNSISFDNVGCDAADEGEDKNEKFWCLRDPMTNGEFAVYSPFLNTK